MLFKVVLNGKIYEVEVEKGNAMIKSEYEAAQPVAPSVAPALPAAQPTAQAAPAAAAPVATGNANTIDAPLPGNINAVKVTTGQVVKAGEVLIILEAMKMENEIVAPKDGKIGQIFVTKGAVVQTGAPLVEIL